MSLNRGTYLGRWAKITTILALLVGPKSVSTTPCNILYINQKAIRRGTFRSVKDLVAQIERFVKQYNTHATPFVWTATADSILGKLERLCERTAGTQP